MKLDSLQGGLPGTGGGGGLPRLIFVGNFLTKYQRTRQVSEELSDRLEGRGYQVLRTSSMIGRAARLTDMVLSLWRYRTHYDVALVDVFSGPSFFWAEISARLLRLFQKPFIFTLHGGGLPGFSEKWPTRVRKGLAMANAVVTPSVYLQKAMHTWRDDLLHIPNGLDTRLYEFRLRDDPAPNLLWLRSFHEIYNPAMVPEILAGLADFWPSAVATMIGPVKDRSDQRVSEIARKLGVFDRLEIIRGIPKERVPQALNRGDIFLNTTNVDNTPVSVIEAMAGGLCVVSTNVGGIPFLLEHEKDALLVPPCDAEAMTSAIRRVIEEPGLAGYLSSNARKKAIKWDWRNVVPMWEALLRTVHSGPADQMIPNSAGELR